MSSSVLICNGGLQPKQTLPGQGPKFGPPQLSHGWVEGDDHGDETLVGPECCFDAGVSGRGVAGREDGPTDVTQSAITESPHSQSQTPHSWQP